MATLDRSTLPISARLLLCAVLVATAACGDDDSTDDGVDAGGTAPDAGGAAPDAGGAAPDAGGGGEGDLGGGSCASDDVCDFECEAGCMVECLGGLCTAECPDGDCALDADFAASADYSCEGGGCVIDCDASSTCELDCPAGGCEVVCDEGSTCTVHCGESGDACSLTCANGGRGTCDGNCTLDGCDLSCEPDPSYAPVMDPIDFTSVIDNPLLPLPVGGMWVYEGDGEVITVEVLSDTRTVNGIECAVVRDTVTDDSGELVEDTLDWFAQDADGAVWYMGEESTEYVDGVAVGMAGSWEAGVDGAVAGYLMKAMPAVGDVYRQEYLACEAEDMGEVVELGVSITVPTGSYDDCIVIRDFSPLDPTANEHKTFCPGVGVVQVRDLIEDEIVETLTELTLP